MQKFGSFFLLVGPIILLLVGTIATFFLFSLRKGKIKWWILAIGPAITFGVTFGATLFVTSVIKPAEGSGFLLGGLAIGLYMVALFAYYPILLIFGLVRYFKKRKKDTSSLELPHKKS